MIIKRTCDLCGAPYVAKSKLSKWCSDRCRIRNHEGKPAPLRTLPVPDVEPLPAVVTGVVRETLAALEALGRTASPEGQAALVLAARIDAGADPLSAMVAAAKQLGDTLAGLRRETGSAADPLDELRRKREERQQGA